MVPAKSMNPSNSMVPCICSDNERSEDVIVVVHVARLFVFVVVIVGGVVGVVNVIVLLLLSITWYTTGDANTLLLLLTISDGKPVRDNTTLRPLQRIVTDVVVVVIVSGVYGRVI